MNRVPAVGEIRPFSGGDFFRSIADGQVPLPLCPAESETVYAGYLTWCWRYGIDSDTINEFIPAFMQAAGLRRFVPRIPDDLGVVRRVRVLCLGDRKIDEFAERRRILDGLPRFRRAVQAYMRSPDGEAGEDAVDGAVEQLNR